MEKCEWKNLPSTQWNYKHFILISTFWTFKTTSHNFYLHSLRKKKKKYQSHERNGCSTLKKPFIEQAVSFRSNHHPISKYLFRPIPTHVCKSMRFEFENRKILTHILLRRNFGCSFMDINNALSAIILEFYLVYAWTKALRDKFHFDTQNSPVSLVHTHWYNTRSKAINVSKTSCCVARPSISGSKFDNCFNIVTEDRQHTINRCHVKSRSSLFWTFAGIFFFRSGSGNQFINCF